MRNKQLSFLEAKKILKQISTLGLPKKSIRILSSIQNSQLDIYLKAFYAKNGSQIEIEKNSYGTLKQTLINNIFDDSNKETIVILMPWDFVECLNWRTGITDKLEKINFLENEIQTFYNLCMELKINNIKFVYFECLAPEILSNITEDKLLKNKIRIYAEKLNCMILENHLFCLSNYLYSGFPFKNKEVGKVAFNIFDYISNKKTIRKIIVLDLDNTLWYGVLGEDGVFGIKADSNNEGYMFFIFQSFLKFLKKNGILLAIVSKNDLDLIDKAFLSNDFILKKEDFIKIIGTYEPKSLQIKNLLKNINLLEESCIFIDDNEIEIKEVSLSSNKIICEQFPNEVDKLPCFISKIRNYFEFNEITTEDKNRTNLYKLQLNNLSNTEGNPSSINNYLKSLYQKLNIKKGERNNFKRAIQLLNKTNQFNLNGIRRSEEEVLKMIDKGNKLFIGELIDKNGSHGEVVVLIIDQAGTINTFVMSCRVFQRKVEYGILAFLKYLNYEEVRFEYLATKTNHPFLNFAKNIATTITGNFYSINLSNQNEILTNTNDILEIKII